MALADFFISLLTFVTIYSLFGLGLNVKFGFTGLIDFGHVAYFMIGAYVTVFVAMPAGLSETYEGLTGLGLATAFAGVPGGDLLGWLVALVIGMAAAALVSVLVGIPTIRLREDYLAITALGIATILNAIFHNERWLFNGAFGIREVHEPLSGAFPIGTGSFQLNLLLFGLPSVAILGYAAYRTAKVVRPLSVRPALLGTGATLALAGSVVFVITTMTGLVVDLGVFVLNVDNTIAFVLLVGSVVAGRAALTETDHIGALLALASALLFTLWYLGQPLVAFVTEGETADLLLNLFWLYDATAGSAGGLDYDRFFFLFTLAFLVGAYLWVERTVNSPYGRVLRAVREDESVPEALGKPTFRYKIQSLMFGSALAGAAGGLWAANIGFIDPTQFASTVTFFAYTAVIIGGTANNRGVILGTAVFWVINSGTRFLDDFFPSEYAQQLAALRLILIGALLIVILYYRPEGMLGEQDYDIDLGRGGVSDD
ncbi:ABC transporter [Haloferax elongans ATCC BAA-1513]|uniref:ABC transporter n=1 Tax=Haloferax elongans ATCC BAA-1513 TaxID=1230453 RepID=M0HD83_HALEO|nr:branched-chain amino acid ABC transporter permease [Haloferax elongans]ELZ81029.1 ABC transporter [Haloferax elongans ATCC BAA-1513]